MPHPKIVAVALLAALPASAWASTDTHASPNFTGPLVTPAVNTLPVGTINIEPYLISTQTRASYDNAGNRHEQHSKLRQWQVAVPMTMALTASNLVQLTLNASRTTGAGMHSDGMRMGDASVRVQQRLLAPRKDGTGLVLALSLTQRLSTGKYHQLSSNPLNATGNGTNRTTVALGGQLLEWLSGEHAVRWRGQLAWSPAPGSVRVRGESVYGTDAGFRGYALVGQAWSASLAAEYVINSRWVLVGEGVWNRSNAVSIVDTRHRGAASERRLAPGQDFSLAPAIEYHFSSTVGLIAGVQFTVGGRNNADYVAPQVALNMVF